MNAILTALATIIGPLELWAEQKLESIGASFLSAMGVIFNGFTNDQRAIGANCTAFWQAKYHALTASGVTPLNAIEQASTATLNEFYNEEKVELTKVVSLTISALEVSVSNAIK